MILKKAKLTINKKSHNLSVVLTIWVYIYAIFYFVPLILPFQTPLMYLSLLLIAVFTVWNTKAVRRSLLIFIICYVLLALLNTAVVSYPYYVAVEAFSGLAVFSPALLVISSHHFDLIDFSASWYRAAVFSTIFTPIAIVLMQWKYIDYGVFTYLNLPNAVIFSYIALITKREKEKILCYCLAVLNFAVILFFGGRMAAVAAAFTIFMGYMLSVNINIVKKVIVIAAAVLAAVLVLSNLNEILYAAEGILNRYNLSSRSVSLLIEQIRTSGAGIYLSGRKIIYEEVIGYIHKRSGLPGGFGVCLEVTDGRYYHPHNLFLQLSVMLGIIGAIMFFILIFARVHRIKKAYSVIEYRFVILLLLDYFVISFTGGSILINYVAVIGIGMLFFYKSHCNDCDVGKNEK